MRAGLMFVCIILVACPALADSSAHLSAIDDLALTLVGEDTPGLAVLVMDNGDVVHMRGYGFADLDAGTEVTEDSIFELASVSKQITALAVMLQIEDGLYIESTPIAQMLPGFPEQDVAGVITVGHLIHHLSGLADYLGDEATIDFGPKTTNRQVLEWAQGQPLDTPPGTAFSYSNTGYVVLAELVAAADAAPSLADVLATRVWQPLGMVSTGLVTPIDPARAVTGYAGTGGNFVPSAFPNLAQGDGNVFTSLQDLALYEAALANNVLLDAQATDVLFSPVAQDDFPPIEKDEDYGFGWSLDGSGGDEIASHSGAWEGTSTFYHRNLTTGVTVILLANGEDIDLDELATMIEAALP